jgi:hypothetical protein
MGKLLEDVVPTLLSALPLDFIILIFNTIDEHLIRVFVFTNFDFYFE